MHKLLLIAPVMLLHGLVHRVVSQTVSYHDVGVIVNDSSAASQQVAAYFMSKRNIPSQNLIHISCTTDDEIDTATFRSIRTQIENYISSHNLDSLNYLVLTKGIPSGIKRGDCSINGPLMCTSVDHELTIMGSGLWPQYPGAGTFNPYLGKREPFSRNSTGIFLVTRLDALSVQDVKNMIDRSGPYTEYDTASANFVFQVDPDTTIGKQINLILLYGLRDSLRARSWNVIDNTDSVPISGASHVAAYAFVWNSAWPPVVSAATAFTWTRGSIAYVPIVLASYLDSSTSVRKNLSAFIREGATGGFQPRYVSSAGDLPYCWKWYPDYFSLKSDGRYFADAIYSASPRLAIQHLIIGDPKARMSKDLNAGIEEDDRQAAFTMYPNPSNGHVIIVSGDGNPFSVRVCDVTGKVLKDAKSEDTNMLELDLSSHADGLYFVQVQRHDRAMTRKLLLRK